MTGTSQTTRAEGFTLIECILALVIIGSAIIAGLSLSEGDAEARLSLDSTWRARLVAQRQFEQMRTLPYVALESRAFAPDDAYPDYEARWVITPTDAVTKKVTIEVAWATPRGQRETLDIETFRCEEAP